MSERTDDDEVFADDADKPDDFFDSVFCANDCGAVINRSMPDQADDEEGNLYCAACTAKMVEAGIAHRRTDDDD